jgi:hypothetical protein
VKLALLLAVSCADTTARDRSAFSAAALAEVYAHELERLQLARDGGMP